MKSAIYHDLGLRNGDPESLPHKLDKGDPITPEQDAEETHRGMIAYLEEINED